MGAQLSKNKGGYLYTESPREQLMKLLVEKTRTAGHMLSFKEASQDPEMVDPNNYAFYFGSFKEAARLAWKKVQNPPQKTDTLDSSIVRTIPGNTKRSKAEESRPHNYCQPGQNATKTGRPSYTREQIRDQVIAFYQRNGRLPNREDSIRDPNLASWATLYKYLGNKNEWGKFIPSFVEETPSRTDNADGLISNAAHGSEKSTTHEEAVITTQQHWEGETLLVEVEIFKPGSQTPVHITLTV